MIAEPRDEDLQVQKRRKDAGETEGAEKRKGALAEYVERMQQISNVPLMNERLINGSSECRKRGREQETGYYVRTC